MASLTERRHGGGGAGGPGAGEAAAAMSARCTVRRAPLPGAPPPPGPRARLKLGRRRGGGYDDVADAVMAGAAVRAGRGEPPYVTRGLGV